MLLTKEQTYKIFVDKSKLSSIANKFKFTNKCEWKCLACLSTIYISYKQYGINAIFCDSCLPKFSTKPTIAQYQYMRVLKENQIKLIESKTQIIVNQEK